ncbi:MAG: ATP-binding cassette domain-containing protein [Planctomycetales bacterium]
MTPAQSILDVRQLRKSYGERFNLDVASLNILKGQVFCILGPTGSGKSTLLRLLASLDPTTNGEIRFNGSATSHGSMPLEIRRRIAMVFQRPQLLRCSVRANVEYGLRMRKQIPLQSERVDQILQRLELSSLSSQSASTLSGGQIQLVALARAFVLEPKLLLLDEPCANLDPARVALVEEVVAELNKKHGTTIIWTTHNVFQAQRVASHVALLLDGQVVESGSNQNFFATPTDPRTADFIQGRMIY